MAKRRRDQRLPKANRIGGTQSSGTSASRAPQPATPPSWRDRLHVGSPVEAPGRKRRISRREKEERQKRQLLLGMTIAGALVVLILLGFAGNEYWIKPRHVLATVDGTKIRRSDYWKVRSYNLLSQAGQFQQLASFTTGDQQTQYQSLAQQALVELDNVWGSTSTDAATLEQMIEDQVYLKNLDDVGAEVTQQDVTDYIDQQFEPVDSPIYTPTATATFIPTRAAWATETAVAQTAEAGGSAASPESDSSPVAQEPTSEATPQASGSPIAAAGSSPAAETTSASPAADGASPIANASPAADSPTIAPTPSPTATPNQEQARQTAEAGYSTFRENAFDRTHLSRSDYERLIVRPAVARQKVRTALEAQVGQSAEQVHAAHILVSTKELADSIYQELQQPNANFEQTAKDQSSDTSTAPNGGDLGWFPRGIMVTAFDDVAFSTEPNQISQPFQTQFGWHIVKVYEKEPDRPLTDDQISQLKTKVVQDWLDARKDEANIDSDVKPTATAADQQFQAPPDAPPTPTTAPTTVASPETMSSASPEAGT